MNIKSLFFILLCISIYSCNDETYTNADNKNKSIKMEESKSFFITDRNDVRHEIFKVSDEDFEKYKREQKLIICDSIFSQYKVSAYKLLDSKVIVEESGRYALYPSMNTLLNVLKNYTGPYKREILFDKNPYGESFPKVTHTLVTQLFDRLGIDTKNISKEELLMKLDEVVLKNRNEVFLEKNFLSFIALIGTYNIEEFKGEWKMVLSDDKLTWNPLIEINNQKVFFADYIREDFSNPNEKRPVTEVYETVRDIIRLNILGKSSL